MDRRPWYVTLAKDYGRRPASKVGGMVTIASLEGRRRVDLRPVADPLAVSMTPVKGWVVPALAARLVRRGPDDAACDMRAGDGWVLPYANAVAAGLLAPDKAAA